MTKQMTDDKILAFLRYIVDVFQTKAQIICEGVLLWNTACNNNQAETLMILLTPGSSNTGAGVGASRSYDIISNK